MNVEAVPNVGLGFYTRLVFSESKLEISMREGECPHVSSCMNKQHVGQEHTYPASSLCPVSMGTLQNGVSDCSNFVYITRGR